MTRVMSCHKYRLSQVLLFLCLVMLMSMMRRVHTYSTCINNATPSSNANMNCTHPPGKIEVLSFLYANFQNQTQPQTCPGSVQGAKCSQIMERGSLLRNNTAFSFCSSQNSCSPAIKRVAEAEEYRNCSTYNYFLANYTCVEDTEIMDLCGDDNQTITSPTHLAYFHQVGNNPVQKCTCVVQGGAHQLRAVSVGIPPGNRSECASASLRVIWIGDGENTTRQITHRSPLTNEYMNNNSDITWIYYTRNCSTITQNVWFEVQPASNSHPTIYCGSSVANGPQATTTVLTTSSKTTLESTTYTYVTSPTTMVNGTKEPSENVTTDTSSMTSSTTWPPLTTENQTEMSPTPSSLSSTAVTTNSTSNTSAVNDPTLKNHSSSKVEVIVGSVIGGFFVVVIAVVLVIVLYRRHKSKKYTQSHHPQSNGANTARYENTSADLPLVAMGPSLHTTGYDHIAAVGTVQGDDNSSMYNNTGNVYNHTLDEEEYDHIQTVATVHPSSAIHRKQTDDTYNNLYEGHTSIVKLKGDKGLSESTTDMNDPNYDANDIYSQIQDKPQSEQPGSDTILHKSHEETKEEFVENDLYQSVEQHDTDKSPTQHAQGGQEPRFYHVLEKDFGSRVPENPPHSLDKNVYKDNTASSTPHISHDLTNEETEFVENDLYQSVDQHDTDKRHTQHAQGGQGLHSYHVLEKDFSLSLPENLPHSADKDVYKDETALSTSHKSHDLTNEETEFVENDLYQSADQL